MGDKKLNSDHFSLLPYNWPNVNTTASAVSKPCELIEEQSIVCIDVLLAIKAKRNYAMKLPGKQKKGELQPRTDL